MVPSLRSLSFEFLLTNRAFAALPKIRYPGRVNHLVELPCLRSVRLCSTLFLELLPLSNINSSFLERCFRPIARSRGSCGINLSFVRVADYLIEETDRR